MPSYKLSYFDVRGCVHNSRIVPLAEASIHD